MMEPTASYELDRLLSEAFEHLEEQRFQLGLTSALKVYEYRPHDSRVLSCLAWASLETGDLKSALAYADLATQEGSDSSLSRFYRAFVLQRVGIFDGAIADLNFIIQKKDEFIARALELKAKCLAGAGQFKEAYRTFEDCARIDKSILKTFPKLRDWYKRAASSQGSLLRKILSQDKELIFEAIEAYNLHEYWFSLWAAGHVIEVPSLSNYHHEAKLLVIESLFQLYQYKPAIAKAEEYKAELSDEIRYKDILIKLSKAEEARIKRNAELSKTKPSHTVAAPQAAPPPSPAPLEQKDFNTHRAESSTILREEIEIVESTEKHHSQTIAAEATPSQLPDKPDDSKKQLEASAQDVIVELSKEAEPHPERIAEPELKSEDPNRIETFEVFEGVKEEQTAAGEKLDGGAGKTFEEEIKVQKRTDFERVEGKEYTVHQAKMYDLLESMKGKGRKYVFQFHTETIRYIGAEIVINNPSFLKNDVSVEGFAVWYLNDLEIGRHPFKLDIKKEWDYVVFSQSWGTDFAGFWEEGQGRVEIFLPEEKLCTRWFLAGDSEILNLTEGDISDIDSQAPVKEIKLPGEQALFTEEEEQDETLPSLMKKLDSYVGLKSVKETMRDFIDYLEFIKERKRLGLKTAENLSIHSVFTGHPGTGKTTIARLLGKIFKAMGVLSKGHVIEVDRAGLVGQYIGETAQKTDAVITESAGGLLFIDEAYTLSKKSSGTQDFGQEAIDTLLKRMEDKAGDFAVIVAGYPEEMQEFLESNPGMKSRFQRFFHFEDFLPEELTEIFKLVSAKEEYTFEENVVDILLAEFTRLYRKRDKTFGNARLVGNTFNDTKMQLGKRYLKMPKEQRNAKALTTFIAEDVKAVFAGGTEKEFKAGIDEDQLKKSLHALEQLIGLASVKKEISEMVKIGRFYASRGESLQDKFSSHVVFLGNPGTGKTTVARLISSIYSALGVLPKGHLVEADRQSLVASYIGKTAEKTTELINKAMGGTLFIDEAYALAKAGDRGGSDFGQEAIDTLLKRMEDDRGKFIVIAAGYTGEMETFLESNPGLKSRFTRFFTFEDYTPDELILITEFFLGLKKLKMSEDTKEKLKVYYNELYRNRDKTFSNGRLARNVADAAIRRQLIRIVDMPFEEVTDENRGVVIDEDFEGLTKVVLQTSAKKIIGNAELLQAHLDELQNMIGLDSVKRSVENLLNSLKVAKMREERGLKVIRKSLHGVFTGNPGTGKTSVARLISKIYKEMGLIEKGHLIEVDRSALVSGYVGQTATKTEEVIQKALGGTLFIDEAYTLYRGGNDFGQEAIDTLLKRMEDFKEQLVVIVAGYPNEMRKFLSSNPGLESRFTNHFQFEDYTPEQMLLIASLMAEKNGYRLDEGAEKSFSKLFEKLYTGRDETFGNARLVQNLLYRAIGFQEERILNIAVIRDEDLMTVCEEDVNRIMNYGL